jgi:hypothetical protein
MNDAPQLDLWLPEAGEFFVPPAAGDGFSPSGAWQNTYAVLVGSPEPTKQERAVRQGGFLRLRRGPGDADGRFALDVELQVSQQQRGVLKTSIAMQCEADRLATPVSWKLSTIVLDAAGEPVELTRVEQSGEIRDGAVVWHGPAERRLAIAPLVTSNWSLFEALGRQVGKPGEPVTFTMLEDLDLVKPEQRLRYRGTVDVQLGQEKLRLIGYQQLGRGILPYQYWLDEAGRLIFACGGLRGFLWNPKAESISPLVAAKKKSSPGGTP